MKRSFLARSVLLVLLGTAAACGGGSRTTSSFATRGEAGGVVPGWVPAAATELKLQSEEGSGAFWLRFRLPAAERRGRRGRAAPDPGPAGGHADVPCAEGGRLVVPRAGRGGPRQGVDGRRGRRLLRGRPVRAAAHVRRVRSRVRRRLRLVGRAIIRSRTGGASC